MVNDFRYADASGNAGRQQTHNDVIFLENFADESPRKVWVDISVARQETTVNNSLESCWRDRECVVGLPSVIYVPLRSKAEALVGCDRVLERSSTGVNGNIGRCPSIVKSGGNKAGRTTQRRGRIR